MTKNLFKFLFMVFFITTLITASMAIYLAHQTSQSDSYRSGLIGMSGITLILGLGYGIWFLFSRPMLTTTQDE